MLTQLEKKASAVYTSAMAGTHEVYHFERLLSLPGFKGRVAQIEEQLRDFAEHDSTDVKAVAIVSPVSTSLPDNPLRAQEKTLERFAYLVGLIRKKSGSETVSGTGLDRNISRTSNALLEGFEKHPDTLGIVDDGLRIVAQVCPIMAFDTLSELRKTASLKQGLNIQLPTLRF